MARYYISNAGDDTNDGLSKLTPWLTIQPLKTLSIKGGDIISFRCGDTFFGDLDFLGTRSANFNEVFINSYGFGEKPKICGYKTLNTSTFTQHLANVWKTDISNVSNYTGNVYTTNTDVGFLKVDEEIYGNKKSAIGNMAQQWDYFSDAQYVYIYSSVTPLSLCNDLRVSVKENALILRNGYNITGLEFLGYGGSGIHGTAQKNVKVSNCDIHEVGGSYLSGTTRWGNGIEIYDSGTDILIENNKVYDCYDVAFTMQGTMATGVLGFENVIFRDNIDWNNTQSFEVWTHNNVENSGFHNCLFENNISINAGRGWGYNARPNKEVSAALLLYDMEAPINDLTVQRNVFFNPRNLYYGTIVYNSINNNVFIKKDLLIHATMSYTIQQNIQFVQSTNKEVGTLFNILVQDYTLTNPSDVIEILSNNIISNYSQLKLLQNTVKNVNLKLEDTKSKLNDIYAFSSGYVSKQTGSSDSSLFCLLSKIKFKNGSRYVHLSIPYMVCRSGVADTCGILNIRIDPSGALTTPSISIKNNVISSDVAILFSDFKSVVEKADGTEVIIGIYFNLGKVSFANLTFRPLIEQYEKDYVDVYYYSNNTLAALPSGTVTSASEVKLYEVKPTTGTAAPASTPSFVGQEFIDTTNKKIYKATGTTSSSDWTILN